MIDVGYANLVQLVESFLKFADFFDVELLFFRFVVFGLAFFFLGDSFGLVRLREVKVFGLVGLDETLCVWLDFVLEAG